MGRTNPKKGSKQTALTGSGFWPMLSKPAIAIGKHASVPGKYWNGCPAADKEKRFMCIVVEFTAMHDFGDGVKGAGFKLKEMGEDGRGSLEPGVASGSEFIMAYPLPFLEHYFFQNRSELPGAVREKAFPADAVIAADAVSGGAADDEDTGGDGELVEVQQEKTRQSCTRMTLACSTPRETQRATWFRLPVARLSCDVRGSPCDAQREMLMNGIRLQS